MIPSGEQRVKEQRFRLNPQGLARKDKRLMSAVEAPEGMTLVSCDLASGEPTCTTHYSGDKNYADATFNMVGKAPFYDGDSVLKIDNLYLTVMSVSPMGKTVTRDLFNAGYQGSSFSERWRDNQAYDDTATFQDYIKDLIKPQYAFHKMGTLGMGYAMGPKKFQNAAYDAGHVISFPQAKDFFNKYWELFADIKRFSNVCANNFKSRGFLVNEFGYRLIPDKDYKAFNYWIQSTVSGIMHVLCAKFFTLAPYCKFLLVIHDEVIFACPTGKLTEARAAMKAAEASLNKNLGWRVNMRVGFATGSNLYEAK
jgi:hypothetical protein